MDHRTAIAPGESVVNGAVEPRPVSWESYSPPARLARDEVHVIRMSLPQDPMVLSHLEKTLSQEEIERAFAFHFQEDRQRHVVARGGLRAVLGHHLGVDPVQLRLGANSHGKPMLADPSGPDDIRFNLSHSGALVLLVLARGREVGVDVEQIRNDVPHLDMAARFFSVAEHEALVAQPPSMRVSFFFETWTRKEAYVKGRGGGLSIPTQQFSVHVDGTTPHPVDDRAPAPSPGSWRVAGIEAAPGYAAAVAMEGNEWRVRCFDADQALHAAATA